MDVQTQFDENDKKHVLGGLVCCKRADGAGNRVMVDQNGNVWQCKAGLFFIRTPSYAKDSFIVIGKNVISICKIMIAQRIHP